jgi:hypothetical protein
MTEEQGFDFSRGSLRRNAQIESGAKSATYAIGNRMKLLESVAIRSFPTGVEDKNSLI